VGYRSTVAYTIRFTPLPNPQTFNETENDDSPTDEEISKCKESFYTFLAEAKVKYSGAFDDESMTVDESNMAINFLVENVKWYEDYEDVMVHEDLLSLSKEWADEGETANKHIGGIFIRIGEELDDIVREAWGEHDWEWLTIHRQIVCDWE